MDMWIAFVNNASVNISGQILVWVSTSVFCLFVCFFSLRRQTGISPIRYLRDCPGWPWGASGVKGQRGRGSCHRLSCLHSHSCHPESCLLSSTVFTRNCLPLPSMGMDRRHKPLHALVSIHAPRHTLPSKEAKLPVEIPPEHTLGCRASGLERPFPCSLLPLSASPSLLCALSCVYSVITALDHLGIFLSGSPKWFTGP